MDATPGAVSGSRRRAVAALAALAAGALVVVPGQAAQAARLTPPAVAPGGSNCAAPGVTTPDVPYPQQMLAPERVWPLTRGARGTVAVLDTGVDATQPQLAGHVAGGLDMLRGGAGDSDCAGHGTQVAGLIVAQSAAGVGFHGFAPDVTVLPIIVADQAATDGADPGVLAQAVTWAVSQHAKVVDVSIPTYTDDARLRAAVAAANAAGAMVVAAAGDQGGDGNTAGPVPYPAAYPGVLGVGAVDSSAARTASSPHGPYVDLVAPGGGVISTQRGRGLAPLDGTAAAAAFVSATAALVRSRYPNLGVDDTSRRLELTAAPAAGGADSDEYGYGLVDPYAAVADDVAGAGNRPAAQRSAAPLSTVDGGHPGAGLAVGLVAAAVGLAMALTTVLPRGRHRRWRPGLAAAPPQAAESEEPTPPLPLFGNGTT